MIINTQLYTKISFARVLPGVFYPYEGYRSVTPLDAARVNRTIFHTILCTDTIYLVIINPHKG